MQCGNHIGVRRKVGRTHIQRDHILTSSLHLAPRCRLVAHSSDGAGRRPDKGQARRLDRIPRDTSTLLVLSGRRRVRCQAATFMDRGFPRKFLLLDELTDDVYIDTIERTTPAGAHAGLTYESILPDAFGNWDQDPVTWCRQKIADGRPVVLGVYSPSDGEDSV